jgi:hypothetical protein
MTLLLEKAYAKLTQAPEKEQERIAALILAELEKPEPEEIDGSITTKKKGFLERLMEIQIDGPEDLSENFEQYANGEKRFDKVR